MLPGLLATFVLAQAQPPAVPAPPAVVAPVAQPAGLPPSIDPLPGGAQAGDGGFSFDTTHNGPPWAFWGGVDYRMMWLKPAASPGVLATANGVPFGAGTTEFGRVNGIGFSVGAWLNDRHTWGVTAGGLLLEQKDTIAAVGGPGTVVRPFTDALTAGPALFLVNAPAAGVTGSLATAQGIRLSGFDVGVVNNLLTTCDCHWAADFTAGFRYLDLDEYLTVTQRSTVTGPLPFAGRPLDGVDALTVTDRFRTRNQFFGPQVGLRGEYRTGSFFASLGGKLGIGNVHQRADIDGRSDVTGVGAVAGGLLATQGSNLGRFTTNRFGVLVDVGVAAGYQFAAWGRAKVGYDFLYLNDVARPGQQVDATLNSRLIPTSRNFAGSSGLTAPVPTGRTDDFFAHGFRVGLELMY